MLCQNLSTALKGTDVAAGQKAYIDARPPYEQIEVLAACFEKADRDIDARPYAFERGEDDSEFRGFHRIEVLLFRDQNLVAAVPYAQGLIRSVRQLIRDLEQRPNFSARNISRE